MKLFKTASITLLSASLLTLSFCKEDEPDPTPKACFTVVNTLVTQGDIVEFENCSKDATSYLWDFGNDSTSKLKTPTHVYETSGTFTIELTTKNGDNKNVATQDLVVMEKVPTKMTITKLVIRQWPEENSQVNVPWDPADGPDLFYSLYQDGILDFIAQEYRSDCVLGTDYSFELNFPYVVTDINSTFKFEFRDFDGVGTSDLMGSMSFVPMDAHDDGVDVIKMVNSDFNFDLHVTWEY